MPPHLYLIATLFFIIGALLMRRRKQTHAYRPMVLGMEPVADHGPRAADLHVVAVFFNFHRFKTPVRNFQRFAKHMADLGVTLHVVELVLRDTPFEVTSADNPRHTRLRTQTEFFQKENLINIGVDRLTQLYPEWRYMAWVDADVEFFNRQVAQDTIYALNRHPVVQMWSRACDLGPDHVPIEFKVPGGRQAIVASFAECYQRDEKRIPALYGVMWHPGYAWAMRRETYEALGGLYENTILGAADHHMAWAFVGRPSQGIHGAASQGYQQDAMAWCARASDVVAGDLGCVPGLIHHHWHGRKEARKYVERWSILVDNGYDPALDLRREPDGLLKLTDRSPELRDGIRDYMLQRNDDANTYA